MWQLLGVLISGATMGCVAYALYKISRNRLPGWLVPVFAASGMFLFMVAYDYTWYGNKAEQVRISQPSADVLFFDQQRERSFFKPWSLIKPAINSFFIFDGSSKVTEQGHERIVEYFLYEFIKDPIERQQVYMVLLNCSALERAVILQGKTAKETRHEKITVDDLFYLKLCR